MVIFGAGKLTQVGTALGRGVKEFKTEAVGGEPDAAITADETDAGSTLGSREVRAAMILRTRLHGGAPNRTAMPGQRRSPSSGAMTCCRGSRTGVGTVVRKPQAPDFRKRLSGVISAGLPHEIALPMPVSSGIEPRWYDLAAGCEASHRHRALTAAHSKISPIDLPDSHVASKLAGSGSARPHSASPEK